jgi:hypothetical protein
MRSAIDLLAGRVSEWSMAEPHGTVTGIELNAGVDEKTQARACSTVAEIVSFPPVDRSTLGATEKLAICGGTGWALLESAGVSVCPSM